MMSRTLLWCIIQTIGLVQSAYTPALTWDVCSPSRIAVTLTGAEEGGIIYIRGYGAACRQTTSANGTQHVFDFLSCGIVTGETYFTIIVQKSPLYQTGADLQESLLCIYDLSDITVGNNVNVGDKDDDGGINKTVKPTGYMILYKDGLDIGGQNVKLSESVTMTIQLDAEFIADFDISVRSCTANYIDIIQNYCSADTALFPNFLHATQGIITSSFGAFRTTDLGGGYVQMIFSCTVEVCRGPCNPEACTNGEEGWGRKRRAASDVTYDELSIGSSFSVGTEKDQQNNAKDSMDQLCIDNIVFILLLLAILGVLVTSLSLTVHVTTKLTKRNDELRNLTGINNRQRKSLMHVVNERRKSSFSILPRQLNLSPGLVSRRKSEGTDIANDVSVGLPNTARNTARGNGKAENVLEQRGVGTTASLSSHADKVFTTNQDGASSSRNASNNPLKQSEGTLQALHTNTVQSNRTWNDVSTKLGTLTLISGHLDEQPSPILGFEKLLGLDAHRLQTMTTAEKKFKLLECQALLNRLTLTKPVP